MVKAGKFSEEERQAGRPKKDRNLQTFVVELRKDDLEKLRVIAKREDSSVGRLVRKAIAQWISTDEMRQQAFNVHDEKKIDFDSILKLLNTLVERTGGSGDESQVQEPPTSEQKKESND